MKQPRESEARVLHRAWWALLRVFRSAENSTWPSGARYLLSTARRQAAHRFSALLLAIFRN
jgi:hypothetical protein